MYEKSSCVGFLWDLIKKEADGQVRIFLLLAFGFVILFEKMYKYRILPIINIIFLFNFF